MEELERFQAVGYGGRRYIVVARARVVEYRDPMGELTRFHGDRELRLLDGRYLTQRQSGAFQVFNSDEIVWRFEN